MFFCKEQSPKIQRKDASDIWNLYKATESWQVYSCYPQKQIQVLLLREHLQDTAVDERNPTSDSRYRNQNHPHMVYLPTFS